MQNLFKRNPDLAAANAARFAASGDKPQRTPQAASSLEAKFDLLWIAADGPKLTPEHRFEPTRKWRADRAHLPSRTLIEIEGWGRHQRWHGYANDCEKYNAATMAGWRVIRLTSTMLQLDIIKQIARWIDGR